MRAVRQPLRPELIGGGTRAPRAVVPNRPSQLAPETKSNQPFSSDAGSHGRPRRNNMCAASVLKHNAKWHEPWFQ